MKRFLMAAVGVGLFSGAASAATYGFQTIALTGQAAPGGGGDFFQLGVPVVNNSGQVAFVGRTNEYNVGAVYTGAAGSLASVIRAGDALPGYPGETIRSFVYAQSPLHTPGFNDNGDVVLDAEVGPGAVGDSGGGLATLATRDGALRVVARDGDAAPGTGQSFEQVGRAAQLDGAGDVTFIGNLDVPAGQPRSALYQERGDGLELIFRSGAPDSYDNPTNLIIWSTVNAAGDVMFATPAGATAEIVLEKDGAFEPVVRRFDPAPGAGGAIFDAVGFASINDDGDVAFGGRILTPGVSLNNVVATNIDGTLTIVAEEGAAAPQSQGATFGSFGSPAINAAGDIAFMGFLFDDGDPLGGSLFATNSGALDLVLGTGSMLEVFAGDMREIASLSFAPNAFNDSGQLAFRAFFTDNTTGLFMASLGGGGGSDGGDPGNGTQPSLVPLPATLWLMLGALGALGLRRRRAA